MKKTLLDRSGKPVAEDRISDFAEQARGKLVLKGGEGYEEARHIWNALVDKHPGAILKCSGTADVVAAVNFARENDVLVAVRGGGHNVGGRALCDDGLVIDLSGLRGIHVDAKAKTVRVQGGATLGDVDHETHAHGLAVPFGVISKTGVAGLTLGGGVGWLIRKYGPTCDSVLEMEVVTSDGAVRTVSPSENADLYWAMRGGGGNFGIATSFLYKAYPVSSVLGGLIVFPREAGRAVLRGYRDFMEKAPVELTVYAGFIWTPDGMPATALVVCWIGEDMAVGERAIAPLKELAEPLMVAVQPMPFPAMQSILDDGFPSGTRNYWKSAYLREMSDEAIDVLVEQAKGMTTPMSALLVELHGTGSQRSRADSAFSQWRSEYLVGFMPQWTDASDDTAQIAWARTAWTAIQPYAAKGYMLNYLSEGEEKAFEDAFGDSYQKLREMKRKYDPANFFSQNQNIQPAA